MNLEGMRRDQIERLITIWRGHLLQWPLDANRRARYEADIAAARARLEALDAMTGEEGAPNGAQVQL
jgi:hypothetical protein